MKRLGSCILLVMLAGCLVSEREQYTLIINEDGRTGTLTVVRRNIQSDSDDSTQQRKDFQELLDNRRSDTYLLSQLEQGFYVKERKLAIERGVLVWREKLLVADITKLIPEFEPGQPIRLAIHDTSGFTMRTNGQLVLHNDSLVIEWPAGSARLELTSIKREFAATSDFPARFKAYRRRHR